MNARDLLPSISISRLFTLVDCVLSSLGPAVPGLSILGGLVSSWIVTCRYVSAHV